MSGPSVTEIDPACAAMLEAAQAPAGGARPGVALAAAEPRAGGGRRRGGGRGIEHLAAAADAAIAYDDVGRWMAARPGAPASPPIEWREVEDATLTPNGFTLRDVPRRLDRTGAPWARLRAHPGSVEPAARRLDRSTE